MLFIMSPASEATLFLTPSSKIRYCQSPAVRVSLDGNCKMPYPVNSARDPEKHSPNVDFKRTASAFIRVQDGSATLHANVHRHRASTQATVANKQTNLYSMVSGTVENRSDKCIPWLCKSKTLAVARVSNSSCKSCLGPGLGFSQAILSLIYFCEHAYKGGSRQQGVDSWIHYHSFIHSAFIPSIIGQSSIRRSKLLYSVFCILISNQYG
jgi:hypothetical protein